MAKKRKYASARRVARDVVHDFMERERDDIGGRMEYARDRRDHVMGEHHGRNVAGD